MTKTLLLVPTEIELTKLRPHLIRDNDVYEKCLVECCGFGLIESAIETSKQLTDASIERIILVGIGGVYSQFWEKVGTASVIQSVVQFGIGSIKNGSFLTPAQMGFSANDRDEIRLITPSSPLGKNNVASGTQLVSVPCVGQFREDEILIKYPNAVCEDMEGYAVACVARDHQIPLTIVRGFSNVVGQDFSAWKIDQAIESAASVLKRLI